MTEIIKSTEQESNVHQIVFKNKKHTRLKLAILYDNMISASYSLDNGDLNSEKITQQSASFQKPIFNK